MATAGKVVAKRVSSDDGTALSIVTAGNPHGLPVLFLHGTCCSHRIWQRQLGDPSLSQGLYMIAPDLRGHGQSDKPQTRAAYAESRFWAQDVRAILDDLAIDKVLVVAWSYGGRVINDYLLCYGEERIAGINFIAAGTLSSNAVKGPGYQILAQLFSDQPDIRQRAELQFVSDLCAAQGDRRFFSELLDDVRNTPLKTRLYMRDRVMNYETLLSQLSIPVHISHGRKDSYSLPLLADMLQRHIPHASLSWFEQDAHMPFYSCAARFNAELLDFAQKVFIQPDRQGLF